MCDVTSQSCVTRLFSSSTQIHRCAATEPSVSHSKYIGSCELPEMERRVQSEHEIRNRAQQLAFDFHEKCKQPVRGEHAPFVT
jgi:hypothetical protein